MEDICLGESEGEKVFLLSDYTHHPHYSLFGSDSRIGLIASSIFDAFRDKKIVIVVSDDIFAPDFNLVGVESIVVDDDFDILNYLERFGDFYTSPLHIRFPLGCRTVLKTAICLAIFYKILYQLDKVGEDYSNYPMGMLMLNNIELGGILSCHSFDLLRRLGRKSGFSVINHVDSNYLMENIYSPSSMHLYGDNVVSVVDGQVVVSQHSRSFILSDVG